MPRPMFIKAETWMSVNRIRSLKPMLFGPNYLVMEETLCGFVYGVVSQEDLASVIFPDDDISTKEDKS